MNFVPTHHDWYNVLLMRMVAHIQKSDPFAMMVAFKFGSLPNVVFMNHLGRESGSNITMITTQQGNATYHEGWFAARMPAYRDTLSMWVFFDDLMIESSNNTTFDCLKMFTPNSKCMTYEVRAPLNGPHKQSGVDVRKVVKMKSSEFFK